MTDVADNNLTLSDAEWRVMDAVWRMGECSVREVLESDAGAGWSYSTVKTLLERLAAKGAVRITSAGRARRFEPLIERESLQQSALRRFVARTFGGQVSQLVKRMVGDERLSSDDIRELRDVLSSLEQDAKTGDGSNGSDR